VILEIALLTSLLAAGEDAPPRAGDTVTKYTVQPGDTLESLSRKYLGDASLWPEYHRLNPQVTDPRRLRIGSTLRIITARVPVARTAQVVLVTKRVEEKPSAADWRPSRAGNVLREKEGLRTGKDSSSALQFDDGTRMNLGEDSLVFLREATSSVAGRKKQSLEVMSGQADLKSRIPRNSRQSDIQILVGKAVVRPNPDESGEGAVRARRAQAGEAEVMVFKGRSQVQSAGVTVAVPQGMGTKVPDGQAPKPPERLLARPTLESPPSTFKSPYANPGFAWRTVAGARSYTVEICADPTCEKLVVRATSLTEPRYRVPRLGVGIYFWRAMAVSANGLDGYPSSTSSVEITSDAVDTDPPLIMAQIHAGWLLGADKETRAAAGAWVAIEARDHVSGLKEIYSRWDGGPWQRTPAETMSACENRCLLGRRHSSVTLSPIPPGPAVHVLDLRAVDVAGQESAVKTLHFQNGGLVDPPRAEKGTGSERVPGGVR
jgi:hypothetical protein